MSQRNHNDVNAYLSLRRVVMLSLAVSVGFHLVFMQAFFFGESLFVKPERAMELRPKTPPRIESSQAADTIHYNKVAPETARPPKAYRPLDDLGVKNKKFRFERVLLQTAYSFVMLMVLLLFIRKILSINMQKKWKEIFCIIFGSVVITTALSIANTYLPLLFEGHGPNRFFLNRLLRDFLLRDFSLTAIVIMACYLLRALYRQKVIAVENEELRTESIRTHYEALKSQLDPHFLFNSMNTLQSLIDIDPSKAGDYVQQLSSVLRYTLQSKEVVTLAEEMNCVQDYCSMMQIRYGDNLSFDIQMDKRFDNAKVLPLAVQGLVENAIKHNVISSKQPLVIQIVTKENAQLEVSNAIQPKIKDEGGEGIGLANLVERYRLQWNREVEICDDGKHFKVTIPLIEKQ
jgi:hypothetical protein